MNRATVRKYGHNFYVPPGAGDVLFASQTSRRCLNAGLSDEERERLQERVERLHRAWPKNRDYLAPPKLGWLAELDPAQIEKPPKGLEVGYVPIATRQELNGK